MLHAEILICFLHSKNRLCIIIYCRQLDGNSKWLKKGNEYKLYVLIILKIAKTLWNKFLLANELLLFVLVLSVFAMYK